MNKTRNSYWMGGIALAVIVFSMFAFLPAVPARADGMITFENGTDREIIYSTIPGLKFTNTNGYNWIYGDWTTGHYNGKYPNGIYTSNGNKFAWLGAQQGIGRIDFTEKKPHYLSLWVSAYEPVTLTGYYGIFNKTVTDILPAKNTGTGKMANLVVRAPNNQRLNYVTVSGTANYWLIDDLSTDAGGVPNQRKPIVIVPGVAGSYLRTWEKAFIGRNDYEVWPNVLTLKRSSDDAFLDPLQLSTDGTIPLLPDDPKYKNVYVGDIIRSPIIGKHVYDIMIDRFVNYGYTEGKDLFVCPYDWRKSIDAIASGGLDHTLSKCVQKALDTSGADKVNIVAHSMGGIISRTFLLDKENADKVENLVTLGTPYFGSPKIALIMVNYGCFIEDGEDCVTSPEEVHKLVQNFPSAFHLAPNPDFLKVYPGFFFRAYDANMDGQIDGYLSDKDQFEILRNLNPILFDQAAGWQKRTAGGWSAGSNQVKVTMFVGDQINTISDIQEHKFAFFDGTTLKFYTTSFVNGDKTVPLHSADLRNDNLTVDMRGDATVYYVQSEHGDLAKNLDILDQILVIFSSTEETNNAPQILHPEVEVPTQPDGLLIKPVETPKALASSALRTYSMPLSGRLITINGPVSIQIQDASGNTMTSIEGGNGVENSIPNLGYDEVGDTRFIFLPETTTYSISLHGQTNGHLYARFLNISNDQEGQTAFYPDIPVTEQSNAFMAYNPAIETPGPFQLDQNGDGTYEAASTPPILLTPQQATDLIPPVSTIRLTGTKGERGWYVGPVTVEITAEDNPGGTGVAKIEYSLDHGKTVQIYTGAFVVDPQVVEMIYARAIDGAGNSEIPLATSKVGEFRRYAPLMGE